MPKHRSSAAPCIRDWRPLPPKSFGRRGARWRAPWTMYYRDAYELFHSTRERRWTRRLRPRSCLRANWDATVRGLLRRWKSSRRLRATTFPKNADSSRGWIVRRLVREGEESGFRMQEPGDGRQKGARSRIERLHSRRHEIRDQHAPRTQTFGLPLRGEFQRSRDGYPERIRLKERDSQES